MLGVPCTYLKVIGDNAESYSTSDVAGILHPALGTIAIPKFRKWEYWKWKY